MFIRQDGPVLEVLAPAKINLFLEVTGKRSDGFHELDMLMVPVALFDTLTVAPAAPGEIQMTARWALGMEARPELPAVEDNLVYRVLTFFQSAVHQQFGHQPGISIELVKRIPAAAGLGGASSDAAAALAAANQLTGELLSFEQLLEIAAEAGSDVPFFLYCSPARCRGRGERVTPLSGGQSFSLVLIKPNQGLSTPSVFSRVADFGFDNRKSIDEMLNAFTSGDLSELGASLHNRLTEPALAECPLLRDLIQSLTGLDVPGFQMTGSGSTFFVICRHRTQAKNLASRLRQMRVGAVLDTYTLDQPFGWAA